ncbi:glucose PTS transporter subunit IIA [Carnobacteriaceae bacterium zg-ZUI240]|nr:glucose PTS transporter subunit IIA [Carnobacteriaceae bacterium zg-ZUI240]
MNSNTIAKEIINLVGGEANVESLTHCMTRLRFVLKDERVVDKEKLEAIPEVLGVAKGAGQIQIIMGKNLLPVYNTIIEHYHFENNFDVEVQKKSKKSKSIVDVLQDIVNYMGGAVSSMIVGLIAGGMLKILLLLISLALPSVVVTNTFKLITFLSDVPFYFMPVLVAYGAAKKLGANQIYSMMVALTLLYPGFTDMVAKGGTTTLFGMPVLLIKYSGSFLPVLLSTVAVYHLEKFFEKIIPGILKPILIGMCTILVASTLTWVVFGPLAIYIGNYFISFLVWMQSVIGPLALAVLSSIIPFLVMTGMHTLFAPFMAQSLSQVGFDGFFRPALMIHNMSEGAACLGIAFKTKNKELRAEALSLSFGCIVAGVSEPALYGLMLRFKKPLYGVMAGGAVGGLVAGLLGAKAFIMGRSTILAIPIFQETIISMLIGIAVAMLTSFVVTYLVGFEDEASTDASNKRTEVGDEVESTLQSIAEGTSFPLEQVKDDVFSKKIMGDGIAFNIIGSSITAPCSGKVTAIFPGGHAVGLTRNDGVEMLIHIGLDTVSLNGYGFKPLVEVNEVVKAGQKLVNVDIDGIKQKGVDLSTMLIITDTKGKEIKFFDYGQVSNGQLIAQIYE